MKMRDNKGSITMFVLVTMVFMSAFLMLSYANNVNKSKISAEQFKQISNTYSYYDGDGNSYNRAYADLRNKNKKVMTKTVSSTSTVVLSHTFEEALSNYRIYGGTTYLGSYDSSTGKYRIQITVTGNGYSNTYHIYMSERLDSNDYIDYKNQCVMSGTQIKEIIAVPTIYTYEEDTTIRIVANTTPYRISVDYIGYEINS